MSSELIERLAREAGMDTLDADGIAADHWLHRFAALVAEECAKVADEMADADAGTLVGETIRSKFRPKAVERGSHER